MGDLPRGLPRLSWPSLSLRDVDGVIPLATACFLLSYIESISAARTMAAKWGYKIDSRQEMLALGAANLAVAFGQGFPVAGGLSQSAVNDKAGARSPLALVFASLTLGVCLLFLTGLLRNLPTVVLASIVLVAVRGLIDVRALRQLKSVSRYEFGISLVALVGVLLLGILKGVLLAAIISLIMLVTMVARPHVAILGRIPNTRRYSDVQRHPDNELIPGVLIVRVESALLYFNVDHIRDLVMTQVLASSSLKLVVFDLSTSPYVDVAGTLMLSALQQELAAAGIQLRLADAHAVVRDLLRAEGLEQRIGHIDRHLSLDQTITEFEQSCPIPS